MLSHNVDLIIIAACHGQPRLGTVGVMQLSEPLLWFILRVLDSEDALQEFDRMGGIKVITFKICSELT